MLKFEDNVYSYGSRFEYINSFSIVRIRLYRKRIYMWIDGKFGAIYVENSERNREVLKSVGVDFEV